MERFTAVQLLLQLLVIIQGSHQRSYESSPTYTAAVVEFSPPPGITIPTINEYIQGNVFTYSQFAKKAAEKDADIIVFPEYGLTSLSLPRNSDGSPAFSVTVPVSSGNRIINPCLDTSSELSEALRNLSCAARENSIYMVINLPEREECSATSWSCHQSGAIYYNTNVAFDREGNIIARYRKTHLFGEAGLTPFPVAETVTFDTDFGVRFGMFICFDLMFEEPAVKLVRDLGVTDIVFPTAWFSELPFLTAVQAQAAWAHANDVNFLASGYDYPPVGSCGSGIYNGKKGAIVATMPQTNTSSLLVASVPKKSITLKTDYLPKGLIIPYGNNIENYQKPSVSDKLHPLAVKKSISATKDSHKGSANSISCRQQNTVFKNDCEEEKNSRLVSSGNIFKDTSTNARTGVYLKRERLTNYATFVISSENLDVEEVFQLCHADFCCNFKIAWHNEKDDDSYYKYRLAAYNGPRSFDGLADGGLQVCAIITCVNDEFSSCGRLSSDSDLKLKRFQNIEISGLFNRSHSLPTPNTLLNEDLIPLPVTSYSFQTQEMSETEVQVTMNSEVDITFLTFGIYSRNFLNDTASY